MHIYTKLCIVRMADKRVYFYMKKSEINSFVISKSWRWSKGGKIQEANDRRKTVLILLCFHVTHEEIYVQTKFSFFVICKKSACLILINYSVTLLHVDVFHLITSENLYINAHKHFRNTAWRNTIICTFGKCEKCFRKFNREFLFPL